MIVKLEENFFLIRNTKCLVVQQKKILSENVVLLNTYLFKIVSTYIVLPSLVG
jgi:hypothetical protein